jgi:hypothetical protein
MDSALCSPSARHTELLMAKSPKSEEELRRLILDEIANPPRVCPPDIDVSIRATEDGDWRADIVPPGRIGYPDCFRHIGEIEQRLRSQYYLSQEAQPLNSGAGTATSQTPAQPRTAWMSPLDDAANKVVQEFADRQRRFVAATASTPTEIPPSHTDEWRRARRTPHMTTGGAKVVGDVM